MTTVIRSAPEFAPVQVPGRAERRTWRQVWTALLAAALIAGGCGQQDAAQADRSQPPPGSSPVAAVDWPTYRGDALCRGLASGALPARLTLRWTFKTGGAIQSSAVVADGRVYFGSDDHRVYALDRITGQQRWTYLTDGAVEAAPLVHDGTVYIGSADTHVYALAADTGAVRWKVATGDKILGAAAVTRMADGKPAILVGSYDNKLYSLAAADGQVQWVYATENYINGTPTVTDRQAIFGGCDKQLHMVDLQTGVAVRKVDLEAPIANTAAVWDNRAYVGHYGNRFVCVNLESGKVDWSYRYRDFAFFSSPAVTADRVVFGARDKRVHCVKRDTGERQWMFATQGAVDSSPVICDDKVVVGSNDGRLYVLDLQTGAEIFQYEIGADIAASPAVVNGWVLIGAGDGVMYAFGPAEAPTAPAATGR